MRSIYFPEANACFGPPKDWDESKGICNHLTLFHNKEDHYVVSAWKPSKEDIERINAGEPIYLQIHGGQPPVSLYTLKEDKSQPNNIDDLFFTEHPPKESFKHCQEIDFCMNRVFARDYSNYEDFVDAVLDKVGT